MSISNIFFVCLALLPATWFVRKVQRNRQRQGYLPPPGPARWPVIGNLLDFGSRQTWSLFQDWAKKYGDLIYLEVLGRPIVVISSADIAFELLEKRAAIYSDRPVSTMDEILGWDWSFALLPYGQRWRDNRRCFHQYFNRLATPRYRDVQTQEVHAFLRRVSEGGGHVSPPDIRRLVASIIANIVYGMSITGLDDTFIRTAETAMDVLNQSKVPGAYWVDFFPMLKYIPAWVPGAKAKQLGARFHPVVQKARSLGFEYTKSTELAKECIALDLITKIEEGEQKNAKQREEVAQDATATAYTASIDTTVSFLSFLLSALATHPEVQRKAQEELDRVVGSKRFPSFDDHASLPYLQAILLECARWQPVVPFLLPHQVIKDDYYKQWLIPKGSVIWANVRHMLHNPQEYPEPERFDPERFIKNGNIDTEVRDPTTLTFGLGRRNCPGRHFATENAFIAATSILYLFDIVPSMDNNGNRLDPTPVSGVFTYPKVMSCLLVPRSAAVETLIISTL